MASVNGNAFSLDTDTLRAMLPDLNLYRRRLFVPEIAVPRHTHPMITRSRARARADADADAEVD